VIEITIPIKVPINILDKISTKASYKYILIDCALEIPNALNNNYIVIE